MKAYKKTALCIASCSLILMPVSPLLASPALARAALSSQFTAAASRSATRAVTTQASTYVGRTAAYQASSYGSRTAASYASHSYTASHGAGSFANVAKSWTPTKTTVTYSNRVMNPVTTRSAAPDFRNIKSVNHGLPIAGSPKALAGIGAKITPAKGVNSANGGIVQFANGDKRLFVSPTVRHYRTVSQKNGLNVNKMQIDHAAAKKLNPNKDWTLLSSSKPSVNMSHGARERIAQAPTVVNGVTYAGPMQIRKLNGYQVENLKRDGLTKTFAGYASNPGQALRNTAIPR